MLSSLSKAFQDRMYSVGLGATLQTDASGKTSLFQANRTELLHTTTPYSWYTAFHSACNLSEFSPAHLSFRKMA